MDSGKLVSATGFASSPGRFSSLAFVFPKRSLRLFCDDDTDEIVADVVDSEPSEAVLETFADLIGSEIEYAWELVNHRGYTDAFQLRFIDPSRTERVVQFEVAGSTIGVSRVVEIDPHG